MSQIDCNTNRANARKAQRDSLLKEFDVAKKDLIKLTQDESKLDTTGDADKDKLRATTAARVHHHLDQNILPTPKEGNRENQEDPAIYNYEMELLSQGIKDKLDILAKITNRIEIIEKEETKISSEVHQMLQESEKDHGASAQRLVDIDNLHQVLAELE